MPTLPTFATQLSAPPGNLRRPRPRPRRRPIDWCVDLLTLAVLFLVYLAGYSGGRDAALSRVPNHPACHPNLRP